jgi:hypothetical protein
MNLVKLREKLYLVSHWGMKNRRLNICMYPEAVCGNGVECKGSGWEFGN